MTPPLVVVGAGVAGLATALAAAPAPVLLLSREAHGAGSASQLAQGGIAAALGDDDTIEAHLADTLAAGAFHNDLARARWLCAQAPATIAWLAQQGVAFDRDAGGGVLLGREGGHRVARIAHAGGDATGAALVAALAARAREAAHIRWLGGMQVEALGLRGQGLGGVRACDAGGTRHDIAASAVVLATGGLGALFARTSNPPGADGAGLALALAAGAAARDLEFVQFHPTALDVPAATNLPLITEALRGAGARLRGAGGRALMDGVHPLADLAPRDVVARRVWQARQHGERVVLDATRVGGEWRQRFPTVLQACLRHGIDPRTQPIPVAAAAHFHMGGIAVDADGASSLPGLYAVGEVACSGVHGANRLASNSLLEGIAHGRRLGAMLSTRATHAAHGALRWHGIGAGLAPVPLAALRDLLWRTAGPVRTSAGLRDALHACTMRHDEGWQMRLAVSLLTAAVRRRDSLGAHWCIDSPADAGAPRTAAT